VNILIIGSFMMDLVVRTPRVPKNGETIIGTSFNRFPGGKGANQAVAASRLGGQVTMVGKVGNDTFGDEMIEALLSNHVETSNILRDDTYSTGIGSITLDERGNNRIIVVPGANLKFTLSELQEVEELIKNADILLVQFEMDDKVIERAVSIADFYGVPVMVNPAPAHKVSDEFLSKITYLTPNETEAEILTGIKVQDMEGAKRAGRILIEKGVDNVIMTLAEKGALLLTETESTHIPGFQVIPKDTVAAGDAFNGALAVQITKGISLVEGIMFANAAGALTVTKEGAIPSLPKEKEVKELMEKSDAFKIIE